MLIKSADDKSRRLALLEDLQKSPVLDARPGRAMSGWPRLCGAWVFARSAAAG